MNGHDITCMYVHVDTYPVISYMFPGMLISVGVSSLQDLDMNSSRNCVILGLSLMMGMTLPSWILQPQNAIHSGYDFINICDLLK